MIVPHNQTAAMVSGAQGLVVGNDATRSALQSHGGIVRIQERKSLAIKSLAALGYLKLHVRDWDNIDTPAGAEEGDYMLTHARPELNMSGVETGEFITDTVLDVYRSGVWVLAFNDIMSTTNTPPSQADLQVVVQGGAFTLFDPAVSADEGYAENQWVYNEADTTFYKSMTDNNTVDLKTAGTTAIATVWTAGTQIVLSEALAAARYSSLLKSLATVVDQTVNKASPFDLYTLDDMRNVLANSGGAHSHTQLHEPNAFNSNHFTLQGTAVSINENYLGNLISTAVATATGVAMPAAVSEYLTHNPSAMEAAVAAYVVNNPTAFDNIINQYLLSQPSC